jgi:hypothetical protein
VQPQTSGAPQQLQAYAVEFGSRGGGTPEESRGISQVLSPPSHLIAQRLWQAQPSYYAVPAKSNAGCNGCAALIRRLARTLYFNSFPHHVGKIRLYAKKSLKQPAERRQLLDGRQARFAGEVIS